MPIHAVPPPPREGSLRVLVTGGSGFIGSHVVDQLLDAGHATRVFDVLDGADTRERCETVVGDLLDAPALQAAAEGCDAIIHLAAAADVGIVAKEPAASEALNARGTLNVLEAARATGARVIYASTIWVYSDVVASEVDEDTPLALPSHLYTATKLAGEMYCRSYEQLFDVPTTILRFGIPYGPRARPAAVLPIFVNKALAGEALTIAGDGKQTRRFVYVEDLADGVVRALAPEAMGRVYNLVGDEDTSVSAIAEAVRAAVGDVEITYTEGRAGDFAGARVCGERAARELGWRARTPYAEGVRRYVAWHRENAARVQAEQPAAAPAVAAVAQAGATAPAPHATAAAVAVAQHRPSAASAPARRAARRLPFVPLRSFTALVSGLLALVVYIVVLHAAGLSNDSWHTVLVVAALGLTASTSARSTGARVAVWITALAGAALLIPAGTSEALDFARLNVPLLTLGIAGAGIGLLGVAGGRRTVLEPSFADRADR
ncbi:MAG: UDP-glucose 4-epimerase [Solirubrobacteraceae bacterium]|nr:UDP-glucose 4-epimerase [Solirubrobacteraceae bacterium]